MISCCRRRSPSVSHARSCWSSRSALRWRHSSSSGRCGSHSRTCSSASKRVGELAERAGPIGGAPAVVHGFAPRLRATEVVREQRRLFVEALGVMPLDRAADRIVQRLALVGEEAFVADLLRQHVREAIAEPRLSLVWRIRPDAASRAMAGTRSTSGPSTSARSACSNSRPNAAATGAPRAPGARGCRDACESPPAPCRAATASRDRLRRRLRRRAPTTAPCSTSARHTCSRKNGLPPVRSKTRRDEPLRHASCAEHGFDDRRRRREVERLELHSCAVDRPLRRARRLRPGGDDEQEPLRRDDLPHPGEHGARGAVRPMPVLEQHDERGLARQDREERASASSRAACRCSPCRCRGSGCDSLGTDSRWR